MLRTLSTALIVRDSENNGTICDSTCAARCRLLPGDSLNLVRVLSVRVNYSQQCRNDINGRWEYSKSIITIYYQNTLRIKKIILKKKYNVIAEPLFMLISWIIYDLIGRSRILCTHRVALAVLCVGQEPLPLKVAPIHLRSWRHSDCQMWESIRVMEFFFYTQRAYYKTTKLQTVGQQSLKDAPKLYRWYAETWVFVMLSRQRPPGKINILYIHVILAYFKHSFWKCQNIFTFFPNQDNILLQMVNPGQFTINLD